MIDITTGLIEDTILLMSLIRKYHCRTLSELSSVSSSLVLKLDTAIEYAKQNRWMNFLEDKFEISDRGHQVLKGFTGVEIEKKTWQDIIMDHIVGANPIWESRIPAGRKEAYLMMPGDVQRCFNLAGLMQQPANHEIITWWDQAAEQVRMKHNMSNDEVGREGEWLTLKYEKDRTGEYPYWESFETNLVGYDIISIVDNESKDRLLIEVKSSKEDISHAKMYLSRNEWNTACHKIEGSRYLFYLWIIGKETRLCKLAPKELVSHIPVEEGAGKWEKVSIPFAEFEEKFKIVTKNQ